MPTVLSRNGYRFHFYSHEGREPAHIHVEKGGAEAKFWLEPITAADNDGFTPTELRKIIVILREHVSYLISKYCEFHGLRTRHRREEGDR